jgi:ZIP family zinc transporter
MFNFILFLLIAAFAQIIGGIISWFFVKKFCRHMRIIVLIEIALMIFVSVLLIEEGFKITPFVIISALLGIVALLILNKTVPHKHQTKAERISFLVFIAMCLHEFPEGMAFGASYLISPSLGLITAVTIALHNIPEGSIVAIPYFIKKKFASGLKAVSITQLLYIVGGLIVYALLINVPQQFQALSMAFAAGAMLYIVFEEFMWMKGCPR